MIERLAVLVDHFPGAANQTRCFSHILNLAAKSILRQFDTPKKSNTEDPEDLDEAANVLTELTRELELDEVTNPEDDDSDDDKGEDNNEGDGDEEDDKQHNERDGMSEEEVLELEESLVPVRLMLAKVIS
jgi:cobalamin biosynthesis Mg chelatase CobN